MKVCFYVCIYVPECMYMNKHKVSYIVTCIVAYETATFHALLIKHQQTDRHLVHFVG